MHAIAKHDSTRRLGFTVLLTLLALMGGGAFNKANAIEIFGNFDQEVKVQLIQVCNDAGNTCAPFGGLPIPAFPPIVELFTDKIWAQAEIDVLFLANRQFNDTDFLSIDSIGELNDLFQGAGHGQSATPTTLNMWFVDALNLPLDVVTSDYLIESVSATIFGVAEQGGRNIAISSPILGASRTDTIAHEIGHALGLDHDSAGGDPNNLMAEGNIRIIPSSLNDIVPEGSLSALTQAQINIATASPFVVSEPTTVGLIALGVLPLFMGKARRRFDPNAA